MVNRHWKGNGSWLNGAIKTMLTVVIAVAAIGVAWGNASARLNGHDLLFEAQEKRFEKLEEKQDRILILVTRIAAHQGIKASGGAS